MTLLLFREMSSDTFHAPAIRKNMNPNLEYIFWNEEEIQKRNGNVIECHRNVTGE